MLVTTCIGGITQDLARIVDPDGIRNGEAGIGRNEHIEINQSSLRGDEPNVLAGLEGMVARYGKNRDPDDLADGIDAGGVGPRRPGYGTQIGPEAIAVEGRV
jgi:hypothetical protein